MVKEIDMKFKIVADSSTDLSEDMKAKMNIEIAPLTLEVEGIRYVDDESFKVAEYIEKANASPVVPKSSCPSPDDYLTRYRGDEEGIFVITLSSELSGSYSTAILAKELLEEENPTKKVHVFDSKAASSAQVNLALKIQECIDADMEFEEIVTLVEAYRDEMKTIFVLEKIDHLQKAGRMSKMKATIANVLNVKLVLVANDDGEIIMHSQARGTKKAISKMIKSLDEFGTITKDKIIVIAHCEAEERAIQIKEKIKETYDFKDVIVVAMKGLSSNYANKGGIVIAY